MPSTENHFININIEKFAFPLVSHWKIFLLNKHTPQPTLKAWSGSACGCISLHFASVERCLASSSKYTIFGSFFRPYVNDWSTLKMIITFQNLSITQVLLLWFLLYSWHLKKNIFECFGTPTFIGTMWKIVQIIRMTVWRRSETQLSSQGKTLFVHSSCVSWIAILYNMQYIHSDFT